MRAKYLTAAHQLPDDLRKLSCRKSMSATDAERYFAALRTIVRRIRDARKCHEQLTGQLIVPEEPPED